MSNSNLTLSEFVLDNLKKRYSILTDIELAKKLGYSSTGTISNWRRRDTINIDRIRKYCPEVSLSELTKMPTTVNDSLTDNEYQAVDLIEKYEQHAADSGVSKKERGLLLEFLSGQADSLAEGLRLLKKLSDPE